MTALLAPGPSRIAVGWRMIPLACLCDWRPFFAAGRGTWKRVTTDGRCPVHGHREEGVS